MDEYGELLDQDTVRFERMLPGPIERVWRYLTESDKRARWLCAGDVETSAGGHIDMLFHNALLSGDNDIPRPDKYKDISGEITFAGTVTRCEPPRLLQHTWEFADEHSEVLFELEEVGDQVRLVLTHRRLETSDIVLSVSCGWHTHLNLLADVLEEKQLRGFYKMHLEYENEYSERLGLG